MEIKVSTESGRVPVTVLHVDGNIDSSTYEQFQSTAKKLIDGGTRYILVDLTHAPFVSSAGLRALHTLFNELRTRNPEANLSDDQIKKGISAGTYKSPHLKLLNLSPETRSAFETSGFDLYIDTFTDGNAALASFSRSAHGRADLSSHLHSKEAFMNLGAIVEVAIGLIFV